MKYLFEYRDAGIIRGLVDHIRRAATRRWTLMEVCGGQTHTIVKQGLDEMLGDAVETMRQAFEKRGKLIVDLLRDIPGVEVAPALGAFYAFPSFKKIIEQKKFGTTCGELTDYLLTQHQIAVVPGGEFGAPGHLRLSFATSEALIEKGCKRIKAALAL